MSTRQTLTINKAEIEKEIIRLKAIGDTIGTLTDEDIGFNEAIRQGIKEILLNITSDIQNTEDSGEIKRQLNKIKIVEYLLGVDGECEEGCKSEINSIRWGLGAIVERTILRIEELYDWETRGGV